MRPARRGADRTTPRRTGRFCFWRQSGSLTNQDIVHYHQLATEVSKLLTNPIELARLFALVNVSTAETGIAGWESKFYYDFWRPVTGIREADAGTGPSGSGDGNPATIGDPGFHPLGAPASNLAGPNFTPPFPAYPSGHAIFGGALFETLRNFFRIDRVTFTFVSDELNGTTVGNDGQVRPLLPRTFTYLSRHPLVIRHDRGNSPRPADCRPCLCKRIPHDDRSTGRIRMGVHFVVARLLLLGSRNSSSTSPKWPADTLKSKVRTAAEPASADPVRSTQTGCESGQAISPGQAVVTAKFDDPPLRDLRYANAKLNASKSRSRTLMAPPPPLGGGGGGIGAETVVAVNVSVTPPIASVTLTAVVKLAEEVTRTHIV